jgi:hypothetical protein
LAICATLGATLVGTPAAAQANWYVNSTAKLDSVIPLGRSATIWSNRLQQERRIFIALPPGYDQGRRTYPVLYVLDADVYFQPAVAAAQYLGSFNGVVPDMIVVGIANRDRDRDFVPVTGETNPNISGDADTFLDFLDLELKPWLAKHYRIQNYYLLFGHSLGGLFAFHALATRPSAFNVYLAASPAIQQNGGRLAAKDLDAIERGGFVRPRMLFYGWGGHEGSIRMAVAAFDRRMREAPHRGLNSIGRLYADDDHCTVPLAILTDGLRSLFRGWRPDVLISAGDLNGVQAHYTALSKRFGLIALPDAAALRGVSSALLDKKDYAAALDAARVFAGAYPDYSLPHAQQGEALAGLGRYDEALSAYGEARALAAAGENGLDDPAKEYAAAMAHIAAMRSQSVRR